MRTRTRWLSPLALLAALCPLSPVSPLSALGPLAAGPARAQEAAPAPAGDTAPPADTAPLDAATMAALLARIDLRQKNTGDFKARAYLETKEKGKADLAYDAVYFRRDADDKFMILFAAPKSEAGKGYLRIDKNLWMYDPGVGKWERRTERERIGGTTSQRNDFDPDEFALEYTHAYVGREMLGKFAVHHLALTAKAGVDVAFPLVDLWIDVATENVLKVQEKALSGRLMRTVYYPKWEKLYSESKKDDVYFPREIRIFDEVEKGNRTQVVMSEIDLNPQPANLFTKAWLESKSR